LSFLNGTLLQLIPIQKIPCPQVDISSFDIYNCIGVGGFSKVFLCRFKEDGKFYAMKLIDKRLILKHKKNKIVMNERNIMESINHPFVIKMKFSFETADNLAFVL
jgi:serine/threonine protein kinase